MTDKQSDKPILDECRNIAEDSLYTAQTHFVMAEKAKSNSLLLILFPSCVAALAGTLTAVGLPSWIGAFAALAGVVTAVAGYCEVGQKEIAHKTAANLFTTLRHEARSIYETLFQEMTHEQLVAEVRRLRDRYNTLCQALETTDTSSFEEAQKRIKEGTFVPDFREKQK